jgi:hypothetical protein
MQLLTLGLYNPQGELRPITFRPGRLNIITGASETGKSALQPIIEFCLGRSEVRIPDGVMEWVAWYGLIVQIGDTQLFCGRPATDTPTSTQAMLLAGHELDLPAFGELHVNTNTAALRGELSARIGIEEYRHLPGPDSMREAYTVSVGQALLLCFQHQREIANDELLFHRQADEGVERALRETLPYFLGAAGPDRAALQAALTDAQRDVRRIERELRQAERERETAGARLQALLALAVDARLTAPLDSDDPQQLIDILRAAAAAPLGTTAVDDPSPRRARRDALLDERQQSRRSLRELEEQIALLRRLSRESDEFQSELGEQVARLTSLDLLGGGGQHHDHRGDSTCPVCGNIVVEGDPAVADLRAAAEALSSELAGAEGTVPRRRKELERLQNEAETARERLRAIAASLEELVRVDQRLAGERVLGQRQAFAQGRISGELERFEAPEDDPRVDLERRLTRARQRVDELEEQFGSDDEEQLQARLDLIANDMTGWAQELELEDSDQRVRLDLSRLNVVTTTRHGRPRPLDRIGSAANHIGYHLVTHLALHKLFVDHARPVPRFLMIDQPSQAWFPEEVLDAEEIEDADWAAVRRQFDLLHRVIQTLGGQLQIIVTDHANLSDSWFQHAVLENWRAGRALLPERWRQR